MALNDLLKFSSFIAVSCVLLFTITDICVALTKQENCKDHILLEEQEWIHGAADCNTQSDPPIQVVQYDCNTWIFRPNKCLTYEGPFMYLFVGKNKALLVDTGTMEDETLMPVYKTVNDLLKSGNESPLPLIVAHTHSHDDHFVGDIQFRGKANVTIVGLGVENIKTFFNIRRWPHGVATLDLGERTIYILPIPGHDPTSVAFYDNKSKLLITGDTLLPGRIHVSDWKSFKKSIRKLWDFSKQHEIVYICGAHIETSLATPSIFYDMYATYHPNEQKLPLSVEDLGLLHDALQSTSTAPKITYFDKFLVFVPDLSVLMFDIQQAEEEIRVAEKQKQKQNGGRGNVTDVV